MSMAVRQLARRAGVFLRRDFLEEWSYPFVVAKELLAVAGGVALLYFLGRLFAGGAAGEAGPLAGYGGDYFVFALFGMVAMDFLWVALKGFNERVRYHQLTGTLEACALTRTPLWQTLALGPSYALCKATVRALLYAGAAVVLAPGALHPSGLGVAALVALLGVIAFVSLGMVSAAITLVIKRGDPLAYAVNGASLLVGGVFYPTSVLPEWLRPATWLVPVTPVLDGLRGALLAGHGIAELGGTLTHLTAYALVAFAAAVFAVRWASERVLRDGTLADY